LFLFEKRDMALTRLHPIFFLAAFFLHIVYGFSQNSYVPDDGLRTTLRKEAWQELKPMTPKKQLFLTGLIFNTNNCFDLFEKAAKQRNWPSYTPTTVLAFREVVLNEVIEGRDYTEDEILAVYNTTKQRLKANNTDVSGDPRALQKKYDPLILESLWIVTLAELIKGRNDDAKNLAQELLNKPINTTNDSQKPSSIAPTVKKEERTPTPKMMPISSSPEVSDIILRTVTNYGLSGVYVDNEVSVLFANGDLLTNPSEPLGELNIAASKRKHPKKWATWKKRGNVLFVTKAWKNKTYDWKKWFKLRPGKKGMELKGSFNTMDAFGGDRVINASTVSFDGKGRFAWKTIKGGDTPWKPVYSKTDSSGTYLIDQYSITLNYNNGQTESFFFGLYPKDNEHFVIGSSHFAPK
jgi:hypothetical protein